MDSDQADVLGKATEAFVADLRHWRAIRGYSQKALARLIGYTASHIGKVETTSLVPSKAFAKAADRELGARGAIFQAWANLQRLSRVPASRNVQAAPVIDDPQSAPGTALVVEHELARLTYLDRVFQTTIQRHLRNVGTKPNGAYLLDVRDDEEWAAVTHPRQSAIGVR